MSRLIDADALYEKTAEWESQALHMCEITMNDEDLTEWKRWSAVLKERSAFKFDISDAPTVDAVEVVRCKDCVHRTDESWCRLMGEYMPNNGFCSRGGKSD